MVTNKFESTYGFNKSELIDLHKSEEEDQQQVDFRKRIKQKIASKRADPRARIYGQMQNHEVVKLVPKLEKRSFQQGALPNFSDKVTARDPRLKVSTNQPDL